MEKLQLADDVLLLDIVVADLPDVVDHRKVEFCSGGGIFICGRDKIERKSELECEFEFKLLTNEIERMVSR